MWVKRAEGRDDAARLDRERQVLAALRHPGIVQVAGPPGGGDGLRLVPVAGGDVAGRRLCAEEVAGLGAAVATIVADLHDLGITHGGLAAEHILVDERGRPVLCSLGRAAPIEEAGGGRRDVADLAGALTGMVAGGRGTRVAKLLARAESKPPAARPLARALATIPGARLPRATGVPPTTGSVTDTSPGGARVGHGAGGGARRRGRWPTLAGGGRSRTWAALAAVASVAVAGTALALRRPAPAPAPVAPPPAGVGRVPCPPVDDGCRPVAMAGAEFLAGGVRWSVGEVGDVVVVGRWECQAGAAPALLRPASGQVWVFDGWAGVGSTVAARLVAVVPGARTLRVLPYASHCDGLEVLGAPRGDRVLGPAAMP